jgi:2-dehydro-3-deoxy-D-arabinonate dehydratase
MPSVSLDRLARPLKYSPLRNAVKICRFLTHDGDIRIGLDDSGTHVLDLSEGGITTLRALLEAADPMDMVRAARRASLPRLEISNVRFAPPVEHQEVWAAGVTYLRSKTARMEESDFSATAYDRVYDADRPEIFFKSIAEKVVTSGDPVGIRRDARWSVPEPELALVVNSRGQIAGCTLGNDMSSRDIEGENLLYLPQAKVYDHSCAIAPWILLGVTEPQAREWTIRSTIQRNGQQVFSGETKIGNIKRSFQELVSYLCRSQKFPHGAVLLTGTGIVPPDDFTLHEHDIVEMEIPAIGRLRNPVAIV